MARGVNKAIIVGRLGQDPDVRYTNNQTAVTTLSVATSEQWKDKQTGEKKEVTEWHRVILWGKLGEIAGEYLRKGSECYFEGRLRTRKWEKDGIERYSTEIIASDMQMLGNKPEGAQSPSQAPSGQSYAQASGGSSVPQQTAGGADFDDDMPFAPYMRGSL